MIRTVKQLDQEGFILSIKSQSPGDQNKKRKLSTSSTNLSSLTQFVQHNTTSYTDTNKFAARLQEIRKVKNEIFEDSKYKKQKFTNNTMIDNISSVNKKKKVKRRKSLRSG